jgi:hypothetical protein
MDLNSDLRKINHLYSRRQGSPACGGICQWHDQPCKRSFSETPLEEFLIRYKKQQIVENHNRLSLDFSTLTFFMSVNNLYNSFVDNSQVAWRFSTIGRRFFYSCGSMKTKSYILSRTDSLSWLVQLLDTVFLATRLLYYTIE